MVGRFRQIPEFLERVSFDQGRGCDHHGFILKRRRSVNSKSLLLPQFCIMTPIFMTFSAGTKLGTYEIVRPLGAGGMGEVYRARDSKLKREIAIKVLPDAFVQEAARVSLFHREAEVLASLNHRHIAAIHGAGIR